MKIWERYLVLQIYFETYEKVLQSEILQVYTSKYLIRYTQQDLIGAAIGGAAAWAYVVATKVQMTAVEVTALPAIAITTSDTMLNYCIGLVIAGAVSFIATFIMGIKEEA